MTSLVKQLKKVTESVSARKFIVAGIVIVLAIALIQPNGDWSNTSLGSLISFLRGKSELNIQDISVQLSDLQAVKSDVQKRSKVFNLKESFTTLIIEGQWQTDETGLELRYQDAEGVWSKVYALQLADGDEGIDGVQTAQYTEPFIVSSATAFELIWDTTVKQADKLNIQTVDLSEGPQISALDAKSVSGVITREQWGADPAWMTWTPQYSNIKLAIIHHTAGSADADPAVTMRSIYFYHAVTRGWGDIGYNYVVDPQGRIYEGRDGGDNVIGAHALGFNTGSLGISLMGNYENDSVTSAATSAIANIIGQRFGQENIDPRARISFNGKTLYTISGHRDTKATACPGANLYAQLPNIRHKAALLVSGALPYADGSFIRGSGPTVYYIQNGIKRAFTHPDTFKSWNPTGIISAQDYEIALYPSGVKMGFAPGVALRKDGTLTVYYIGQDEKRRAIPDPYTYQLLGLNASKVLSAKPEHFVLNASDTKLVLPHDGDFMKTPGGPAIYRIDNMQKRPFPTMNIWLTWNAVDQVMDVSEEYFKLYATGKAQGFAEDTLVRSSTSPAVYLIHNEQKRMFATQADLEFFGYSMEDIVSATDNELTFHVTGAAMRVLETGTLVQTTGPAIYYIENGTRRTFPTYNIFSFWRGEKSVMTLSADELALYERGPAMGLPNGMVVSAIGSPAVYLIVDGEKHMFASATALFLLGYTFDDVIAVNSKDLDYNPAGPAIRVHENGTLIKTATSGNIYIIENGQKRWFPTARILNTWFASPTVEDILQSEMDLYPEGDPMGFANGTLIRVDGTPAVYLIENGYKRPFASSAAFTGMGFSWSDILIITAGELQYNPTGPAIYVEEDTPTSGTGVRGEDIRVGIANVSTATVKALGAAQVALRDANDNITVLKTLASGQTVTFSWTNTTYQITGSGIEYNGVRTPQIYSTDTSRPAVEVTSYEDRPAWNTSLNDNLFRGKIELYRSAETYTVWVVNELPLEDYIWGVAETSNSSHPEFQKALLTAARTYAQYIVDIGGKHAAKGFDIHNKTDQVYRGYNFELRSPTVVASANATRGKMVTYNGEVVVTPYFSSSDGRTRAWSEVWNGDRDWLVSVEDPYCVGRPLSGHGVGMSGYGALKMAEHGSNYLQILNHYYTGVQIQSQY
ncbi:N-acetylmuramoyl-L-alanine amidase [Patescibacteria group bacterium]